MPSEITQYQIHYAFDYVETGHLRWKFGRRVAGHLAGKMTSGGYIKITIDGEKYFAHRLIWLWHRGYMPGIIDHINCIGHDNRIENLREVTASENARHWKRGPWHGTIVHGGKYQARISIDGVRYSLGHFDTREEAKAAYDAAALEYYGDFTIE